MEPSTPSQVDLVTSILILGAAGLSMLAIVSQIETLNRDISQLSQSIASLKSTYAGRSFGLEIDPGAETQFDYASFLHYTFLQEEQASNDPTITNNNKSKVELVHSEKMPDPCSILKRQGQIDVGQRQNVVSNTISGTKP